MNFSKTNPISVFSKSCTTINNCDSTDSKKQKPIQPSFDDKLFFNTNKKPNMIVPL